MASVPSRQALQYLARVCRTADRPLSSTPMFCAHLSTKHNSSFSRDQFLRQPFSTSVRKAEQPSQKESTTSLPDITNYYTLFPTAIPDGPPSTSNPSSQFSIALPALRKEFLRLQSLHHPDKYDPSTAAHQKALALSSLINNAYRTLSDPLLRAQYLLQLNHNIDVTSEDNSAHPTDQETLIEVMEAQERIEEADEQQDIDTLKVENEERIRSTVKTMGEAFEKGDVDAAKTECVKLKYWRSLEQGLRDWEPGKEVRLVH